MSWALKQVEFGEVAKRVKHLPSERVGAIDSFTRFFREGKEHVFMNVKFDNQETVQFLLVPGNLWEVWREDGKQSH